MTVLKKIVNTLKIAGIVAFTMLVIYIVWALNYNYQTIIILKNNKILIEVKVSNDQTIIKDIITGHEIVLNDKKIHFYESGMDIHFSDTNDGWVVNYYEYQNTFSFLPENTEESIKQIISKNRRLTFNVERNLRVDLFNDPSITWNSTIKELRVEKE